MRPTSPTEQLASFAVEWRPGRLPEDAAREATRALLDVVGVALVGSVEPASRIVAGVARREGGDGPAVLIGHAARTSASFAALVNGTTGHALDFDASATLATTGHPTVCVCPAALAAAEEMGASGAELLEAIVVGFETIARIGPAGGGEDGDFYHRGFHGTSVFGVFGATAAAARLYGLDPGQARNALGIAASGAKGIRANYGTMTKPLHAGVASQSGILAALLAREGFTANLEALESRFGWAAAVTGGADRLAGCTEGLGERLAITGGVNFKQFPSCGSSHPAIRAVLRLLREHELGAEEVERIEIAMSARVASETLIYPWPTIGLEGKFSLAFLVAAAWVDRRVAVDTFTDEKVIALAPYRDRVSVIGVEGRPPVVARLWTRDGRVLVAEEPTGKPTFADPNAELLRLSEAELAEKFRANVTAVRSVDQAEALLGALGHLAEAPSLKELADLLW